MKAVFRFTLDAIYIVIIFLVTLGGAVGIDELVKLLRPLGIDGVVIAMLNMLARGIVLFDVIGVMIAGGVSLWRFCNALRAELSNDKPGRTPNAQTAKDGDG